MSERDVPLHWQKDYLIKKYVDEEYSMKEIGDFCGVAPNTVLHFMEKHGIQRRNGSDKVTRRKRDHYSRIRKGKPVWNQGMKGNYDKWTKRGKDAPGYLGGVSERGNRGYRNILKPDHPSADANGYVFEHRLVCEDLLGRYLTDEEIVHHRNKNRLDNRPSNLFIFYGHGTHLSFHKAQLRDMALTEEEFCRGEDFVYV